jgi:hypothetical protein
VPVVQPVPAELTQDCAPAPYPDRIDGDAIIDRVVSLETCVAQLRAQAAKLRP